MDTIRHNSKLEKTRDHKYPRHAHITTTSSSRLTVVLAQLCKCQGLISPHSTTLWQLNFLRKKQQLKFPTANIPGWDNWVYKAPKNKSQQNLNPWKSPLVTDNTMQFSSVQSLEWLGHRGNIIGSIDLLAVFSTGNHSEFWHGQGCLLFEVVQHFFCWHQCHPPSKISWTVVLERLSWQVTCTIADND